MPLDRTEIDSWPALIAGGNHVLMCMYTWVMHVCTHMYMLGLFRCICTYVYLYGYVWDIDLFKCIYICLYVYTYVS
jgi:hypothetical protein